MIGFQLINTTLWEPISGLMARWILWGPKWREGCGSMKLVRKICLPYCVYAWIISLRNIIRSVSHGARVRDVQRSAVPLVCTTCSYVRYQKKLTQNGIFQSRQEYPYFHLLHKQGIVYTVYIRGYARNYIKQPRSVRLLNSFNRRWRNEIFGEGLS